MEPTRPVITAEDLLAKLRQGVQESHEIVMRGARIPMRVLTLDEKNKIRQEAKKQVLISKGDEVDANVEIQRATLALASSVPMGEAPILGPKVLAALSVDELNYLFEEYIAIEARMNPALEQILPEEFRELVEALKKNLVSSKDCSLKQLRAICSAFQEMIQRPEQV